MNKQKRINSNRIDCDTPCYFGITFGAFIAICSGLMLTIGAAQADQKSEEWIYTFIEGDNLWNITEKYLDGMQYWPQLQKINNVKRPRYMPPGTQIRIPLHWLRIKETEAKVRISAGENVYIPEGESEEFPLTEDTVLRAGDQVMISEDGNALLEFADGSLMHLQRSTELELQRVNRFSDSNLTDTQSLMKAGRSEIKVKSRGTRFEIRTPAANTSVRGTDFRTSVDPGDSDISRIEVIKGIVGVSGAGRTRELKSGFGTSITRGESPKSPIKLLPAPTVDLPKAYSREFPVTFRWTPVTNAAAYRLQLSRTDEPEKTIQDLITEVPVYSTNELDDADYVLQLRAIDSNGLEGLEQTLFFKLDAQPQPPAAITPRHNDVVRSMQPRFEWSQPTNADSFRFQLSHDMKFDQTVIDIEGYSRTYLTTGKIVPGVYFWRLASSKKGEKGPFSQPLKFTFRPRPDAPDVSTEVEETELTIRWSPARRGQDFRLQVAEDMEFKNILMDERLESPEWRMERPQAPVFFRVQIIDVDGFQGAWSIPQEIRPLPLPWYYSVIPPLLIMLIAI